MWKINGRSKGDNRENARNGDGEMRRIRRTKAIKGHYKEFDKMTSREAEVLAMLIDTDGSIGKSDRGLYITMEVGMKSLLPVMMFCKWGGTTFKHEKNGEPIYRWNVEQRPRVKTFLQKIKRYLLVRKPQAELALKMIDIAERKPKNYKTTLRRLGDKLSELKHPKLPDYSKDDFKEIAESVAHGKIPTYETLMNVSSFERSR